ncbi:MAG: flagellar brake protein [Burkholderiaceae bacterium]
MQIDESAIAQEDNPYRIHSRREIASILRGIAAQKQLVRLTIDGNDSVITSILDVDEPADTVVVDCAPDPEFNARIAAARRAGFDTTLDQISIRFESEGLRECLYEERPALAMSLPRSLIRLQRREFYRVETPRMNPLRCTIQIPPEGGRRSVTLPLQNVSGGGIAMIDEDNLLHAAVGMGFQDCRIELPNRTFLVVDLQIRNIREVKLQNGKTVRRLGCLFSELPKPMLAAVQRYITKLERERNAKNAASD